MAVMQEKYVGTFCNLNWIEKQLLLNLKEKQPIQTESEKADENKCEIR